MTKDILISILKIEKLDDGNIHIYPLRYSNELFEYVYRTASGIRWNNDLHCFYKYEAQRWEDVDFILNTMISVKDEYNKLLAIDEKTKTINISDKSLNKLIFNYFKMFIVGKDKYPYVYVNSDGSVCEISLSERIYLQTKYHGGDDDRPYIKNNYQERTPDYKLHGFCLRSKIPKDVTIQIENIDSNFILIKDEIKRVHDMGYEIDYEGIGYIRIVNSV